MFTVKSMIGVVVIAASTGVATSAPVEADPVRTAVNNRVQLKKSGASDGAEEMQR